MAGTIIADYIRTDANKLSLNVGNTTFATINATGFYSNTGVQLINQNGQISADSIQTGNLNAGLLTTGTVGKPRLPSGSILQVVQTVSTTQVGYTGTSFQTVSSLTTSITPTSSTSKIMVFLNLTIGLQDNSYAFMKLQRNGSDISGAKGSPTGTQTAAGIELLLSLNSSTLTQHAYNNTFMYLDSPATTSSTTYSIVLNAQQVGSLTAYLNRGYNVTGDANNIAGISTMTLMEIAA